MAALNVSFLAPWFVGFIPVALLAKRISVVGVASRR